MTADWLFDDLPARFAPLLTDYAGDPTLDGPLLDALTLHHEGRLRIVWAPFDRLNAEARLVIVGITPGRVQAENALRGFRGALLQGRSIGQTLAAAKATGSFSGPMRSNLVAMLDHVGANTALGVDSTASMFPPGAGAAAACRPCRAGSDLTPTASEPAGTAGLSAAADPNLAACP